MIITLKGADFSASNIGTLSTWRITRSLGTGASYEGPTSVDKGAALNATVTIAEGYELGTTGVIVTMGGNVISVATVDGNTIAIAITEVTGNVVIKVPTVNVNTGEEEDPEIPDVPNPEPVLVWYTEQINQPGLTTPVDLTSAPYGYTDALCANYYNKNINRVRLKVAQDGTISLGTCSADRKTLLSTYSINVVTGTDIYELPETFTLADGEGVWIGKSTDTGKSYCSIAANDKSGTFFSKVGTSAPAAAHNSNYSLGFDLGYFG